MEQKREGMVKWKGKTGIKASKGEEERNNALLG